MSLLGAQFAFLFGLLFLLSGTFFVGYTIGTTINQRRLARKVTWR